MDCTKPFVRAGRAYPCGQCLPCKFRQRRVWFNRLQLEASQHAYTSVCTLTYDEVALPEDGELQPEHLRNWLKRLRARSLERYPWRYVRFFASGEYGGHSKRPHYHVVLFGYPGCYRGRTGRQWCEDCGCDQCVDISSTWGLGASSLDAAHPRSLAYVCGYVTAKLTGDRVKKSTQPFVRMSNGGRSGKGGIGMSAMWDVASTMLEYGLQSRGVPLKLQSSNGPMVLGRYLRRKLGEFTGVDVEEVPADEAVQSVFEYAWNNSINPREVFRQINEAYSSQLAQREALKPKGLINEAQ